MNLINSALEGLKVFVGLVLVVTAFGIFFVYPFAFIGTFVVLTMLSIPFLVVWMNMEEKKQERLAKQDAVPDTIPDEWLTK